MELAVTDAEVLPVCKGDRLNPGVFEVAAVPVSDSIELVDPLEDAVSDWIELPEIDAIPVNVFTTVTVTGEV